VIINTRQEAVIDKVKEVILGCTSAGSNVFVNKGDSLEIDLLPAVIIEQGDITALGDLPTINLGFYDVDIEIFINIIDGVTVESPITSVNNIHAQVHKALLADHTIGLPFVQSLYADGAGAPSVEQAGVAIVRLNTRWFVRFRMNYIDISL